jgi:MFS family permease
LITFVTYGIGNWIGSLFAGWVKSYFTSAGGTNWTGVFIVPCFLTVLCAADEIAVELFLSQRIKFTDIARLVDQILEEHIAIAHPTLEEIMAADIWAREKVMQLVTEG